MNAPILNSALRKVNKSSFVLAWGLGILCAVLTIALMILYYTQKDQKK